MKKCQHCGAEIGHDELFCSQCGQLVEREKQHCVDCNRELKPDAKFCSFCGKHVVTKEGTAKIDTKNIPAEKEIKGIEPLIKPSTELLKKEDRASEDNEVTSDDTGVKEETIFDEIAKEKARKNTDDDIEKIGKVGTEEQRKAETDLIGDDFLTAEVDVKMPSKAKYIVLGIIAFLLVAVVVLWVKIIPGALDKRGGDTKEPDKKVSVSSGEESATSSSSEGEESSVDVSEIENKDAFKYIAEDRIKPNWEEVKNFDKNGLAWVKKNGRIGVINLEGNYVIPLEYDSIGEFSENIAPVSIGGAYGLINTEGKMIKPLEYDYASGFSEGMSVVVKEEKYGYISTLGEEVIPLQYDHATKFADGFAAVKKGNDTYFIDSTGEKVSENYDGAGFFSEGLAPVEMNGKWGYVDTSMNLVIGYSFDIVNSFTSGAAIVTQNEEHFFIDRVGKECSPKVDEIWPLSEGLATVKVNELYGYVDGKSTEYIIEPQYTDAYAYSQGMCTVQDVQGNWYYVDKNNKPVIEKAFDEAFQFREDFARIRVGAKYTIIGKDGNQAVAKQWDKVGEYSNKMLAVAEGEYWGFVEIIAP